MRGRRTGDIGIDVSKAERVLVLRLDDIGDVVMTTALLRELRRLLPEAWITLAVKPSTYNLVELCPYVDEVLVFDPPYARHWLKRSQLHNCWYAFRFARHNLWHRDFDLAIVPRWDVDNYSASSLAYFSGAIRRLGYSESVIAHKRAANYGFDCMFTHVMRDQTVKHDVEHNLDVVRFMGGAVEQTGLEIWTSPADEMFAENALNSPAVLSGQPLIAFGLGAQARKRQWPVENFAQVAEWLNQRYNALILAVGGRDDEALGQELQRRLGEIVINMTGQTTLRQTAALLKRCRLFIGNDSGSMHLAAAMAVPVVEISCHPTAGPAWHPNSPIRFGPWGVPHSVLQPEEASAPCSGACTADRAHCILNITVEQVKAAVAAQLSRQIDSTPSRQVQEYAS